MINGHPNKESYVYALAESYTNGVLTTDAIVETINIGELDFQSNLSYGYSKITPLEPDLVSAIDKIKKAVTLGNSIGLEVHAGHGLTYKSAKILSKTKGIKEFNIGHFLVGESIFVGLSETINQFKKIIK